MAAWALSQPGVDSEPGGTRLGGPGEGDVVTTWPEVGGDNLSLSHAPVYRA
jgi:hypothetical protein